MQGEQKGGRGRSGDRKCAFLCLESVLTENSKRTELSATKMACRYVIDLLGDILCTSLKLLHTPVFLPTYFIHLYFTMQTVASYAQKSFLLHSYSWLCATQCGNTATTAAFDLSRQI